MADHLVGREQQQDVVNRFVDRLSTRGGTLIISGRPGSGKTALARYAIDRAAPAGYEIVQATGTRAESALPFGVLNQLLTPFAAAGVPIHLHAALGFADGPPNTPATIAAEIVDLLGPAPTLLVVDHADLADPDSVAVLNHLAGGLAGTRIGLIIVPRADFGPVPDATRVSLPPLTAEQSRALLDRRCPGLDDRLRAEIVARAAGNPLALLDLAGAGHAQGARAELRRTVSALAPAAFETLLDAVLRDTAPAPLDHPLTPSVVLEVSTLEQRRRSHLRLARERPDDPEWRAGHLAQASAGPDEPTAALLETAAAAALRRGDGITAAGRLRRAAELSADRRAKGRRLIEAARVRVQIAGDLGTVPDLLAEARDADPALATSLDCAAVTATVLLNGHGDVAGAYRTLIRALENAGPGVAERSGYAAAVRALLLVCTFGRRASPWLDDTIAGLPPDAGPELIVQAALAGHPVEHLARPLRRIAGTGAGSGAAALAIAADVMLSMDSFLAGHWDDALELARDGAELADRHGYPLQAWAARHTEVLIAAARGDHATVDRLGALTQEWAVPRGVHKLRADQLHADALLALGDENFQEAYDILQFAAGPSPAGWTVLDHVEVCLAVGRVGQARGHVAAAREAGRSPRRAFIRAGVEAMVADDDQAEALFRTALADPGRQARTFHRARVEFAYGRWLRRQRRNRDAREVLAAALLSFERLDAAPWIRRARREFDATGPARRADAGKGLLAPQQRIVAELAADGLTNRQIGEKLQMSHRTAGAHLREIFRRLNVSSRAEIRDSL